MAFSRRSGARFALNAWPGFVDALTALLLVLFFVISIFMIVQSILRATVSSQEDELDALATEVSTLAAALGLEQQKTDRLATRVGELDGALDEAAQRSAEQQALISSLTIERDNAAARIASFETQVASLLAQNTDLTTSLQSAQDSLETQQAELEAARSAAEGNTAELETARATIAELEAANQREISQKRRCNLPWPGRVTRLMRLRRRHASLPPGAKPCRRWWPTCGPEFPNVTRPLKKRVRVFAKAQKAPRPLPMNNRR